MPTSLKPIIGIVELVSLRGVTSGVPAKIDTGADSSAIWASDIHVTKDGTLQFRLFDEGSPFYTGEVLERSEYTVSRVRSSNGESQVRYGVYFTVQIANKAIRVKLNLSDRSKNAFKILIGRRSISGKFLVDVRKGRELLPKPTMTADLKGKLAEDPHKFHNKYVKKEA